MPTLRHAALRAVACLVATCAVAESGYAASPEARKGKQPPRQTVQAAPAPRVATADEFRLRPLLLPTLPSDDLVRPAVSVPGLYPSD